MFYYLYLKEFVSGSLLGIWIKLHKIPLTSGGFPNDSFAYLDNCFHNFENHFRWENSEFSCEKNPPYFWPARSRIHNLPDARFHCVKYPLNYCPVKNYYYSWIQYNNELCSQRLKET